MKKPYNGHESFSAWNVALYLSNIERHYRTIQRIIKGSITVQEAINKAIEHFSGYVTPDGIKASKRSIKLHIISEWAERGK